MITALIYNDQSNDCTYYLGAERSEAAHLISLKIMRALHQDAVDKLRAELSQEWDEDNLSAVWYDPRLIRAPSVGECIPDIYVTVETARGPRWIAVPDIGDLIDGIRLRDYGLFDAIDGEDILDISETRPTCPEYSSDDLTCEVYSVRIVTHGGEDVSVRVLDCQTLLAAKSHASRIYWEHIADQPTLIDVIVTRDTLTKCGHECISEGPVVYSPTDYIRSVQ